MDLIVSIVLFVISIFVLVKSSDFFVDSVAKIAKLFGVSNFVIGMSVVAIGTSLPELITSVFAAALGNSELVVGNIVGSNIANIGLIVGLGAIIVTLHITKRMYREDAIILAFVTLIFFFFGLNGIISRTEGIILALFFILFLVYLFKFSPIPETQEKEIEQDAAFHLSKINKASLKELGIAAISLIFLLYSAKVVVNSGVSIAEHIGVPINVISVTMIALGTSLPELTVAISSLKKGLKNMLIGNIIGSNVINLLLIGGVSAMITPLIINSYSLFFTIPAMILLTSMLMFFMKRHTKLVRWEGIVMLAFYVIFIVGVWLISV